MVTCILGIGGACTNTKKFFVDTELRKVQGTEESRQEGAIDSGKRPSSGIVCRSYRGAKLPKLDASFVRIVT